MIPFIEICLAPARTFFEIIFWPLRHWHPIWAVLLASLLTSWIVVWIFGRLSDQEQIKILKSRIQGNLFGIWVYQSSIGVVLRLQRKILVDTWRYFRESLLAVTALIPILFLILTPLNRYFSHRPLTPGLSTIVNVRLHNARDAFRQIRLEVPDGVVLETAAVRNFPAREVSWRIRPQQPGRSDLLVKVRRESVTKSLYAGSAWTSISPRRTTSLADWIWNSSEHRIAPGSQLRSVEVRYAELRFALGDWELHWLVVFLASSMVFALLLRKPLRVHL